MSKQIHQKVIRANKVNKRTNKGNRPTKANNEHKENKENKANNEHKSKQKREKIPPNLRFLYALMCPKTTPYIGLSSLMCPLKYVKIVKK